MGKTTEIPALPDIHPSEDVLEEYVFERLPDNESAGVEEHLLVCPQCRQSIQRIDEFIFALRQIGEDAALRLTRREKRARAIGFGAALSAAAMGLALSPILPALHRLPPTRRVELVAFRGSNAAMVTAQAGAPLDLVIDISDLSFSAEYRVRIFDASGTEVWSGRVPASGDRLAARMAPGLKRGVYWVRLYSDQKLLREFGLRAD